MQRLSSKDLKFFTKLRKQYCPNFTSGKTEVQKNMWVSELNIWIILQI